jgi:3-oxoacyl-[acyl-carrier-protein] synthase-3
LPIGGHREPFELHHFLPLASQESDGGNSLNLGKYIKKTYPHDLIMEGTDVLSFSTKEVPLAVEQTLKYANLEKGHIHHYIFHQANKMINETIRKKLQLSCEVVPSSLHDFGNSSGASLPVTMTVRIRDQLEQKENKLLLCGFGVGLSWGTCILDINKGVFPELIISKS